MTDTLTADEIAALPGMVKPLVWCQHPDAEHDPECNEHYGGGQNNLAGQNEYIVYPHPCAIGYFVLDVMGNRCDEDFPSVEAAKAAAQADYEARILGALDLSTVTAQQREIERLQTVVDNMHGVVREHHATIRKLMDTPQEKPHE